MSARKIISRAVVFWALCAVLWGSVFLLWSSLAEGAERRFLAHAGAGAFITEISYRLTDLFVDQEDHPMLYLIAGGILAGTVNSITVNVTDQDHEDRVDWSIGMDGVIVFECIHTWIKARGR